MRYRVYYMRPESFRNLIHGLELAKEFTPDALPRVNDLGRSHIYLRTVDAPDLNQLYHECQGEIWSPNGEARALIRSKGLKHTSMSVGDIAVDENGDVWIVEPIGFEKLGNTGEAS